jgi:2-dehydro-3-deoxyphosphogluconate aldolase/(4S)-4-hydroxy-2-oxoglutarate aldolase
MSRVEIVNRIIEGGVVAVLRLNDEENFLKISEAIYHGGITSLELTMTTPNALKLLEDALKVFDNDMLFGVGSVLTEQMAKDAINAGARYIVSPVYKKILIEAAHLNDIPIMPGAFSPTEIQTAFENGADIIKVFPADILGMSYFRAIKVPLPHLKLMPTGGVTLTNAADWLKAGACAVGIGTALLSKTAIESKDYSKLTENAKILIENIKQYRQQNLSSSNLIRN